MHQPSKTVRLIQEVTPGWWGAPSALAAGAEILGALAATRWDLIAWIAEARVRVDGVFLVCMVPENVSAKDLAAHRDAVLKQLDELHPELLPKPPTRPAPGATDAR
jgi:hypothetical protein